MYNTVQKDIADLRDVGNWIMLEEGESQLYETRDISGDMRVVGSTSVLAAT